ncbi:hypothetical protein [Buttiauxella brennerae]|uniref:hypothetical protein n=1 Tax=Buttiauxella brennerae TaxID=82988 RepID=UPI00286F273E|nr:hypothetical protein [Buttiauxella brennerae]
MNQYERVDKDNLLRILAIGVAIEKDIADNPHKISNNLRNYTANQRRKAAEVINKQSTNYYSKFSYQQNVLFKAVCILELLGYEQSALELADVTRRLELNDGLFNMMTEQVIDGAIKKHRSDSASVPRHLEKEEIIDVVRATWIMYPWGSKTRMISYILEAYRVTDKTLKGWMRDEGLTPLADFKNENFSLVIPEKWKK